MMRLKKMYGVSCGSVMWRNCDQLLAPSTPAASYKLRGIDFSPASQMIMLPPAPQRLIRMSDGLLHAGDCSHSGPCTPNHESMLFNIPPCGLKIQTHSTLAATIGTIAG